MDRPLRILVADDEPDTREFFELVKVQDAHDRRKCHDFNGTEPWACGDCDCTRRLEDKLQSVGGPFVQSLKTVGNR